MRQRYISSRGGAAFVLHTFLGLGLRTTNQFANNRSPLIRNARPVKLRQNAASCPRMAVSYSDSKRFDDHAHGKHDHAHSHGHDEHSHSHEHGHSHSHSHSHDGGTDCCSCGAVGALPQNVNFGPLQAPLESLMGFYTSLRVTSIAAACLAFSLVLRLAGTHMLLVNAFVLIAGTLTLLPGLLHSIFGLYESRGASIGAGVLMSFAACASVATGHLFEGVFLATLYSWAHAGSSAVTARANRTLAGLREMTPEAALVLRSGSLTMHDVVPIRNVSVGDRVLVRAGEMIPCDGVVVEGTCGAFISAPHLTGETTPRAVEAGNEVPGGARTVDAPLIVRVTRTGDESSLGRIEKIVSDAQSARPAYLSWYDRVASTYSRSVLIGTAIFALVLPFIIPSVSFLGTQGSLMRALGLVVVFSPCALILGAPVAYVAALSTFARSGILVKTGASAIEQAAKAKRVVFDKTGTLTYGKLAWVGCDHLVHGRWVPLEGEKLRNVVAIGIALERNDVHPIAAAITDHGKRMNVEGLEAKGVRTYPGQGIEGFVAGGNVTRIGQVDFAANADAKHHVEHAVESARNLGENVAVMRHNDDHYVIRLRDMVRENAKDTVRDIQDAGCRVSVLTGDAKGAAQYVADAVGIHSCCINSEATPEFKLQYITEQTKKATSHGGTSIMVGDGVNDAPALSGAHIGVVCGLTSATAVHAADVVLARGDVSQVAWFLRHSKRTQNVVTQNLVFGLIFMFGAAAPIVHGSLPLWAAIIIHEGGTILAGFNGLRLLRGNSATEKRQTVLKVTEVKGKEPTKAAASCC